jgi:hypothetical protein
MSAGVNPTVLQMLERYVGKRVRVILERNFGFEGLVATISQEPSGIWLSEAEAVIMRTTIANPVPQVIGREDRSELFINLKYVERIEVLH